MVAGVSHYSHGPAVGIALILTGLRSDGLQPRLTGQVFPGFAIVLDEKTASRAQAPRHARLHRQCPTGLDVQGDIASEKAIETAPVRFEGLEDERTWLLSRVERVREDYRARLNAQEEGLKDLARSVSWSFSLYCTDREPQNALLALYGALSEPRRR